MSKSKATTSNSYGLLTQPCTYVQARIAEYKTDPWKAYKTTVKSDIEVVAIVGMVSGGAVAACTSLGIIGGSIAGGFIFSFTLAMPAWWYGDLKIARRPVIAATAFIVIGVIHSINNINSAPRITGASDPKQKEGTSDPKQKEGTPGAESGSTDSSRPATPTQEAQPVVGDAEPAPNVKEVVQPVAGDTSPVYSSHAGTPTQEAQPITASAPPTDSPRAGTPTQEAQPVARDEAPADDLTILFSDDTKALSADDAPVVDAGGDLGRTEETPEPTCVGSLPNDGN